MIVFVSELYEIDRRLTVVVCVAQCYFQSIGTDILGVPRLFLVPNPNTNPNPYSYTPMT